jgi:hypothetical protein
VTQPQPAPRVGRARRRRVALDRSIRLLIGINIVLVASVAVALGYQVLSSPAGHPEQAPPAPTDSPDVMLMGVAHIPTSNACVLCHNEGGGAGLKVVPAILHPIEGWRRCTVCHTDPTLGRQAPGHEGIAEEECLNCHRVGEAGPAITQPHAALHDQACLDCHGSVAHLPSSMASSRETDCVLCHKPTPLPPPAYPHAADAALSCRECHRSEQVGGLPIDHALRSDSTCLLCHEIQVEGSPGPTILPAEVSYRLLVAR